MNDNDITALPGMPTPKAKTKCSKTKCAFWILLFVVLLAAVAMFFCPYYTQRQNTATAQDIVQMQQRLTGLENSVRALDGRINTLSPTAETAPPVANEAPTQNTASKQSAADIARLQSDVVAMSSALTALQNEVKETSSHAQHSQQATQSALASAIAYIQLRAVAVTNQPFTTELTAMRDASPNDSDFQQALGKLQPIAATGAPTIPELRDGLMTLEASASQAIDQHDAQNWWQKFVVELKGLVSVRKLHGGEVDAFGAIESDLAKNDLSAALADLKNLPTEAQMVLNDWRAKMEARQTVNDALHNLSEHFNALAKPASNQGEP